MMRRLIDIQTTADRDSDIKQARKVLIEVKLKSARTDVCNGKAEGDEITEALDSGVPEPD